MGTMLRSDLMTKCDFYVQLEAGFHLMTRLGDMGCVQFFDMNEEIQAFQRKYITEVCRCEEMERKLRYMENELLKDNILVIEPKVIPEPIPAKDLVMYETIFEKWENDITEMSANQTNLLKNYLQLSEMYYVLTHVGPILGNAEIYLTRTAELGKEGQLVVVTGVILRNRSYHLEMMLWRISRGNIFYRQASEDKILTDPISGRDLRKVAFVAICQGTQLSVRMLKICDAFHANVYPCPNTPAERFTMSNQLETRLHDMDQVLMKTKFHRCKALRTVGRQWRSWMMAVKKTKAVFHHLNLFTLDITRKCLIGSGWIPNQDLKDVQQAMDESSEAVQTRAPSFITKVKTDEEPPTYHRTNKFTRAFQNLINAYGDSTYRELNPGLYTIVTFPFLFAMMFGDVGHAFLMFLFAFWMVYKEKEFEAERSTNEIWNIFFSGRYVILLMGIFSMVTGFLYNDIFSIGMVFMDSQWDYNLKAYTDVSNSKSYQLDPKTDANVQPYIWGVDPIWLAASNKIVVQNSLKMKLSIIIGVIHMIFGLVLSFFNHLYFKKTYAIFFEFLPQFIFLACLFLYLVFMMYFKWFIFTGFETDVKTSAGCAPLILIYFIDMVLMSETKAKEEDCDAFMYPNQYLVQRCLLVIGMLCIPILLFAGPCWLVRKSKKQREEILERYKSESYFDDDDDDEDDKQGDYSMHAEPSKSHHTKENMEQQKLAELEKAHVTFGELMTHQGVHTIEFVLSTISHTASYLRLWALSLAHAQLSEMLWGMIFSQLALQKHSYAGIIWIFLIFPVWAVFSLSIMVLMEGLSAFLHTLRLHWVEFMSKFYTGGGYKFLPFSFRALLSSDTEDKPSAVCSRFTKRETGAGA